MLSGLLGNSIIILRTASECQKILPPNLHTAAISRHLAKDSACGENSFARFKNPNRSRISKAVSRATADLDRIVSDRSKHRLQHADRASHRQTANPIASRPKSHTKTKRGPSAPAGYVDARTVTTAPHPLYFNQSPVRVQYFLARTHNMPRPTRPSQSHIALMWVIYGLCGPWGPR